MNAIIDWKNPHSIFLYVWCRSSYRANHSTLWTVSHRWQHENDANSYLEYSTHIWVHIICHCVHMKGKWRHCCPATTSFRHWIAYIIAQHTKSLDKLLRNICVFVNHLTIFNSAIERNLALAIDFVDKSVNFSYILSHSSISIYIEHIACSLE